MAAGPDGTPGPPATVATVAPRTFREHYLIDTNDPYRGRYDNIFSLFSTTGTPPATSEYILDSLVQTELGTPKTLIGLFQDSRDAAGLSLVFNGIHKMPNTLGAPTQWDGKVLMLAGEVVDGQIASVELPTTGFFIPNNEAHVLIPDTLEKVDEVLTSNPAAPLIAPVTEGTANTKKVRTRYLMYVPPRYVPIVVHRRMNPRQLWDELVGAIRANNEVDICRELVEWVTIALMQAGRNLPSVLVTTRPTLSLIPDEVYFRRQREVLVAQLPGLSTDSTESQRGSLANAQLATFVGQLVEEQRLARVETRERADEKRTPKTPTSYWGEEACIFLCTMCQVDSEDLLPTVWTMIAAAGKRDRIAVENAILATARRLQLVESAPLVTPDFAKKLTNLQLAGMDVDNFTEGVQPFALLVPDHGAIVNNTNAQAVQAARQLMDEYDLMTDGSVNTTLADAKTIRTPSASATRLVVDLSHLRTVLEAMSVVLQTVLGQQHPVAINFHLFLTTYCRRENHYKARLNALHVDHAPSRLLRFIQIRLINWFKAVRNTGDRQPAPEFLPVLVSLDNCETFWIPTLPTQYQAPGPVTVKLPTSSTPSHGPPSTISGSSGVSPSTSTTAGSTATSTITTSPRRVTVINSNKNPLFEAFKDQLSRGKINLAIKQHGPPPAVNYNGAPVNMCASYHLRGVCWSSCPRAVDHTTHSAADDEALLAWCSKALAPSQA